MVSKLSVNRTSLLTQGLRTNDRSNHAYHEDADISDRVVQRGEHWLSAEEMILRAYLTRMISNISDVNATFLPDLTSYGVFKRLTGF